MTSPVGYREIFFHTYPEPPWNCFFCGAELPTKLDVAAVHHRDGNRKNNAPENLVAAHGPCHSEYHNSIRPRKQRKIKLPKKLEPEEVERLLAAPNRAAITGLRNRCMIELMYRSGLRVSEVCNLKPRDINLKKHRLSVWDGKGGDRTTGWAAGTQLDLVLDEWVRRRKTECAKSDYFFSTIDGAKVSTRYVQQMMKRMGKRAGFSEEDLKLRITPHKLRHTFATEFLETGGTIQQLQLLLGHKNVSTTQIYMHINPEDALDAVDLMSRRKRA